MNTHVEIDGVSATDKKSTNKMVPTKTTLNVALRRESDGAVMNGAREFVGV
jgi:hypothetical protein